MRSRSRAEILDRLLGLLPGAATATAEGAWVFVAYAALQLTQGSLHLDLWIFVLTAGAGILVARKGRGRAGFPAVAALVVVAGLVGWLADAEMRASLARGALEPGTASRLAGVLLGLAAWRGSRHGDAATDDLAVASLLTWGIPGLAIPWLLGTATGSRPAFVEAALPATLLFVAAGLVAIGLSRLDALGRAVGVDWRRNRAWLGLLFGVVALVLAIGAPVAVLLGVSIEALTRTVFGPLGAAVGAANAVVGRAIEAGAGLIGPPPAASPAPPGPLPPGPAGPGVPGWAANVAALAIGGVFVVAALLVWRLARGGRPGLPIDPPRAEERRIALPRLSVHLSVPHLPTLSIARRHPPRTATEAYVAMLDALEDDERIARRPTESPRAHARRLRDQGHGALPLELLAADYQLERYAGVSLGPTETARAIRRSRTVGSAIRTAGRRPATERAG